MKKTLSIVLVLALALCLVGAGSAVDQGDGDFADIDINSAPSGPVMVFIFVDENGSEIYRETKEKVRFAMSPITIVVNEGEIAEVIPSAHTIRNLQKNGGTASFTWAGQAGTEYCEMTVVVSGLAPEVVEMQTLAISNAEILKLLHFADVIVSEETRVNSAAYRVGGFDEVAFEEKESMWVGEIPAEYTAEKLGVLDIAFSNGGAQFNVIIPSRELEAIGMEDGLELRAAGSAHFVSYGDEAMKVVSHGGELGLAPDIPAAARAASGSEFTGWLLDGSEVGVETKIYDDAELDEGYVNVTEDGGVVTISNEGDAITKLIEAEYGRVEASSIRIRLESKDNEGNEGYCRNGWDEGFNTYTIYNCTTETNAGLEYQNTYIPLEEVTMLGIFAENDAGEVIYKVEVDKLELTGEDGSYGIALKSEEEEEQGIELETELRFAYMNGRSPGIFAPEETVTRAEAAAIVYRCFTEGTREYLADKAFFRDVNRGSWYYDAVSYMAGAGLIGGRSFGYFEPDAAITRAELIDMVVKVLGIEAEGDGYFSDVAGHWAEAAINAAYERGLINGYGDGSFRPDETVTRAETVKMLNRMLGRTPSNATVGTRISWQDVPITAWYYAEVQEATNGDGIHYSLG